MTPPGAGMTPPEAGMTGRLVLARHGETASNVAHRLDSRPPGAPLTERGHAQAAALAEALAGQPVVAVLSSVAVRAQQTAAPVAAALGLEVQVRPLLHETDAGDYEDRSDEAAHHGFGTVYGAWHAGALETVMPGGESGAQVLARFTPTLDAVRPLLVDGTVVVVSHGAAIRLVGAVLAGVDGRFAVSTRLENTETVVLEPVGAHGWRCVAWGPHVPPFTAPVGSGVDDGA